MKCPSCGMENLGIAKTELGELWYCHSGCKTLFTIRNGKIIERVSLGMSIFRHLRRN